MVKQVCVRGCPDRKPGCHDSCQKYQEWKARQLADKQYTKEQIQASWLHRNDFDQEFWMSQKRK